MLVTGGNRGIGRAIAQAFLDAEDQVAVTYRSGEPPAGFLGVKCDVTDSEQVEAAIKEGLTRASKTLRHLDWFEVTQIRGSISDGGPGWYQVGMKVGFRLED